MVEILSVSQASRWARNGQPGGRIEYFRGFLAVGVAPGGVTLTKGDRNKLVRLAAWFHNAAEQGLVHLVQARHGQGDTSYWAVLRRASAGRGHNGHSVVAPSAIPNRITVWRCSQIAIDCLRELGWPSLCRLPAKGVRFDA